MASAWQWIKDRFGLQEIHENFLLRRVPKDPWYTGDGMAMVLLFVIQLATGVVLALSYSPAVGSAYASVQHITVHDVLGWFIRGLHYWSAGLWIVLLFYHLMRQLLVGGYKSPREGTWLLGVLLLYIVFLMSLIGYVLRWDERGIYALRVALNIFHQVPWIGNHIVLFVQGGPMITDLTLSRLYAAHVVFGPLLLAALIGYHLYLIVLRGTTASAEKKQPIVSAEHQKAVYEREAQHPEKGEVFFPETQVRLAWIPLLTFALAIGLTLVLGARQLYPQANLVETSFPMEEWWFAWYSALTALLPGWAAPHFHWLFPIVLFVVLVALPFVDRWKDNRGARNRPIAVTVVVLLVFAVLYLSAQRIRSPWTAWPTNEPPQVPPGIELTERVERGRILFAAYGCNSCHAVAGDGPEFAPDIAVLRQRYSLDGLRHYILSPPPGVPMPAYRDRIGETELALVAEFCHVAQTFPRGR